MLITFEGLPVSGCKTQQRMLGEYLRSRGSEPVVTTCEPGWNNETSGLIKYMALEGNTCPVEKLFLFLADRAGHFERFVRPIFNQGAGLARYPRSSDSHPNYHSVTKPVILCDKGPDSTIAYQGFASNLASIPFLVEANRIAMQGVRIDATIFLDISEETFLKRMSDERQSKFLKEKEFFHRVRKGYSEIAKAEPERFIVVDGEGTITDVHTRVVSVMESLMQSR